MRLGASEFIVLIVMATAVCWIVWVIVGFLRRRDQLRAAAELQLKLLERAGSAREFGELLNSEAGLRLMQTMAAEQGVKPHVRMMRTVQAALLLVGVGLSLFFYIENTYTPIDVGANATVSVFATMAFGAGVALLVATRISYKLTKRLGLPPFESERQDPRSGQTPL